MNTCTTNVATAQKQLQSTTSSIQLQQLQKFIAAASVEATAAQTASSTTVTDVFNQANLAATTVIAAQAAVQIVQTEVGTSAYLTDVSALDTAKPTAFDVASAQTDAMPSTSTAVPTGSLSVSGGSLVSQMNLISTNASTLQTTVCDPTSSLYTGG
jgi:hypothetical protein